MASAYDKASLVMLPNAYKDGKVYSVKPEDRSGDFTFTRSTAATRVNADGNIEKETGNLLTQSNSFNNWTNYLTTETSGQADRSGGTSAWLLEKTGASGSIYRTPSTSGVSTFSAYVKAGTLNWVRLDFVGGGSKGYFDLQNGVVGSVTGSPIDSAIEDYGNGWYRCSVTTTSTGSGVGIIPAESDGSISGTSGNIYIQDAQLEQGLVARDYIETTTSAVYGGITDNVPRLDYTDSSCPALLLEPLRTNLIKSSEYFESSYWSKLGVYEVDTNTTETLSPVGNYSATKIVADTSTTSQHTVYGNVSQSSGTQYAVSIFAKAAEYDYLFFRGLGLGASGGARFNISTGEVVAVNGYDSATIEDYGNGWYRCIAIGTSTSTGAPYYHMSPTSSYTSFAGNNSDGIYIWGAQCEEGSYPTSYIPTYGSSVSRVAETCNNAGNANTFNSTEGVLYAEIAALADDLTRRIITITDGTLNNIVKLEYKNLSNQIEAVLYNGNTECLILHTLSDETEFNKIAFKYKQNDFSLFVNGIKVGTDTSGVVFTPNTLNNLSFNQGGGNNLYGNVKQVLTFNTALTDTELQDLTTL